MRPRSPRRPRPQFEPLESRRPLDGSTGHLFAEVLNAAHPPAGSNIVYTADASGPERLDVREPVGTAPVGGWPVVVAIHGGGWRGGDKSSYEATVDPTLLGAGFAAVAPDYVLSKPGHPTWPENLDELHQALRWVGAHAATYDLDASTIAVMGDSAGADLALMLATDPGSPRIKSVVDFYGPTDLKALDEQSPAAALAVTQYLGGPPTKDPGRYTDASPVDHVTASTPPVLIVHGSADPLVPPDQSVELSQVLTVDGVPNQLVIVPAARHGFGLDVNGIDLGPTVVAFLDQTLGR